MSCWLSPTGSNPSKRLVGGSLIGISCPIRYLLGRIKARGLYRGQNYKDVYMIKSPCTGHCRVKEGHCTGCFRTVEEISNWRSMGEQEKREVCFKICNRRSSVQAVRDEGVSNDEQN